MTNDPWAYYGKPVTADRLAHAEEHLKAMCPEWGTEQRTAVLGVFREAVERDMPSWVLGADPKGPAGALDLTGRFRLLAAMLTAAAPEDGAP